MAMEANLVRWFRELRVILRCRAASWAIEARRAGTLRSARN